MAGGKRKQLVWLFCINLFISSFTFGGGYVVIPMIRKYFVQKKKYLTEEEVMELAAISQSSPGAIAVNLSALAGYKTAGSGNSVCDLCLVCGILSKSAGGCRAERDGGWCSRFDRGFAYRYGTDGSAGKITASHRYDPSRLHRQLFPEYQCGRYPDSLLYYLYRNRLAEKALRIQAGKRHRRLAIGG